MNNTFSTLWEVGDDLIVGDSTGHIATTTRQFREEHPEAFGGEAAPRVTHSDADVITLETDKGEHFGQVRISRFQLANGYVAKVGYSRILNTWFIQGQPFKGQYERAFIEGR